MSYYKNYIFVTLFRIIAVIVVILTSYLVFKYIPLFSSQKYLRIVAISIVSIVYVIVENQYIRSRYFSHFDKLTIKQFIFYSKDFLLFSVVVIVGLVGLLSLTKTSDIATHIFLGIGLLSVILGIETRKSFNKYFHSIYTSRHIEANFYRLSFSILITIICSLLLLKSGYFYFYLSGISIGMFAYSLILYLKYEKNRKFSRASTDYFIADVLPNIPKDSTLYTISLDYIDKKYRHCIKELNSLVKNDDSIDNKTKINALHLLARAYFNNDKYLHAFGCIDELEEIVTKSQKFIIPLLKYKFYNELGIYDEALDTIKEAIIKYPDKNILKINYSIHLINSDKHKEAQELLMPIIQNKFWRNTINTSFALNNYAYSLIRDILIKTDFFGVLKDNNDKNKIFKYKPSEYKTILQASVYVNLAKTINSDMQPFLPDKYFEEILEARKTFFEDTLGYLELALGNFNSALDIFENVLLKDPRQSWNRYHLAELNGLLGHKRAAKWNYRIFHSESNIALNERTSMNKTLLPLLLSAEKKVKFINDKKYLYHYLNAQN